MKNRNFESSVRVAHADHKLTGSWRKNQAVQTMMSRLKPEIQSQISILMPWSGNMALFLLGEPPGL